MAIPSPAASSASASVEWSYAYPELLPGKLIKRYKRFLADIQLDTGDRITAHCPNTGPMTGVCHIGNPVMVSRSNNPKRKLDYTWELISVPDARNPQKFVWTSINTALPNRVMQSALEHRLFPELGSYETIKPEVRYGTDNKSRIDFLLTGTPDNKPIYVEVKNTTWATGLRARFPDTVTTRGQKHLRELTSLIPNARSVMVYFISREDCKEFSPGDGSDPLYGQLLREAKNQGVEILPLRFQMTPDCIRYRGKAVLVLEDMQPANP
ncbi:MAG: DNA/RNA nuclease SfsA [Cyanobacteria bacterium J06623_4]